MNFGGFINAGSSAVISLPWSHCVHYCVHGFRRVVGSSGCAEGILSPSSHVATLILIAIYAGLWGYTLGYLNNI